jgi:hypothetical protein
MSRPPDPSAVAHFSFTRPRRGDPAHLGNQETLRRHDVPAQGTTSQPTTTLGYERFPGDDRLP